MRKHDTVRSMPGLVVATLLAASCSTTRGANDEFANGSAVRSRLEVSFGQIVWIEAEVLPAFGKGGESLLRVLRVGDRDLAKPVDILWTHGGLQAGQPEPHGRNGFVLEAGGTCRSRIGRIGGEFATPLSAAGAARSPWL